MGIAATAVERASSVAPQSLAGDGSTAIRGQSEKCRDPFLVVSLGGGGGLLTYVRGDGSYLHTLNTESGLSRKLEDLGLRLEGDVLHEMDAGRTDLVQLQIKAVDLEEELEGLQRRAITLPIPIASVGALLGYGLSQSDLSAAAGAVGAGGLVAAVWYVVVTVLRLHRKREELDRFHDEIAEALELAPGPPGDS